MGGRAGWTTALLLRADGGGASALRRLRPAGPPPQGRRVGVATDAGRGGRGALPATDARGHARRETPLGAADRRRCRPACSRNKKGDHPGCARTGWHDPPGQQPVREMGPLARGDGVDASTPAECQRDTPQPEPLQGRPRHYVMIQKKSDVFVSERGSFLLSDDFLYG